MQLASANCMRTTSVQHEIKVQGTVVAASRIIMRALQRWSRVVSHSAVLTFARRAPAPPQTAHSNAIAAAQRREHQFPYPRTAQ